MKNFKFNAITALIIGVNVAVANAADGNILNITTQDAVNANKTPEATNVKGPGHTAIGQQNQIYSISAAEAEESQGSSSAIGNQNVVKGEQANAIVMGMMHMVILPKVLVMITKFMPIILLDLVLTIKLVLNV